MNELEKVPKITKQEKELLLERRIDKIDTDRRYAYEIFKNYRVEKVTPAESYKEWQGLNYKDKKKFVDQVIEIENKAFLSQGKALYGMNLFKIMSFVSECKDRQLKEFKIR